MAAHTSRRRPAGAQWRDRGLRPGPWPAAVLLLVWGPCVLAAQWELEPFARVAETWTDNVALSADDEEDEFITEVSPGIRVRGESARAELDFQYRLRNQFFARESGRNRTTSLAAGDGEIELVRRRLFIEGDLSRTEQFGSADGIGPSGGGFAGGTQRTVTTAGIAPRLEYQFGRMAGLRARYGLDHVDFDDGRETVSRVGTVALTSGPVFNRWGWRIDYSRRDEDQDRGGAVDEEDTVLERASAELSLRVATSTQLFAVGGQEDNSFRSEVEGERIDGSFWEAGFRWRPNRRVSLEAAAGERFFGDTVRASLQARGRSLDLDLRVSEDLVTVSQLQLERSDVLVRDQDGNLVLGPDGEPVTVAIGLPTVADDVIQQRRSQASIGWSRGHSQLRLSLIATDRQFLGEGTQEDSRQADLDWTWTRLANTTVTAGIGFAEQEFEGSDREDDTHSLRLGARRDLRPNLDARLDYEFFERDSSIDSQGFTSNRITLAVEATF